MKDNKTQTSRLLAFSAWRLTELHQVLGGNEDEGEGEGGTSGGSGTTPPPPSQEEGPPIPPPISS